MTFDNGKDQKVQFKLQDIQKEIPPRTTKYSDDDLRLNFEKIYQEIKNIFIK